jgi:hypothetical protein
MSEKRMAPLLEKHYGELKFDLRLKHRATGKFIGKGSLVDEQLDALVYECGPKGMTVRAVFLWFAEDAGCNWLLSAHAAGEFEIVSELGEM